MSYGVYTNRGIPIKEDDGCYGERFFVDGTNGNDGNVGTRPDKAFKTIQKAVDLQIENATGLGDKITIFPGDYAENVTGNLTNVMVEGAGLGMRKKVNIKPVTGNGYTGYVTGSIIKGIAFWEPTGAGGTAAAAIQRLIESAIMDCNFVGTTGHGESTGLRIGTETTPEDYEQVVGSLITRCMFDHSGGRTKELGYGINFGLTDTSTQSSTRIFAFSEISHCQIFAEYSGIRLYVDAANGGGVIKHNIIGSRQNSGNTSQFGIDSRGDSTDLLTKVLDNRICATVDAIYGFTSGNVQGNIVSLDGGTPAAETA